MTPTEPDLGLGYEVDLAGEPEGPDPEGDVLGWSDFVTDEQGRPIPDEPNLL